VQVPKLPLYAQLKEALIEQIGRGDLVPGAQLPSHSELCERYGMSYMTIRRAITELINEGVLYAIHGKGVYVAERKQAAEAGPLVGFTEDMARRGLSAASKLLVAEIVGASTIISQLLGVPLGAPLVYLYRLRLAGGEPMALQTAYLPHERCPGLLAHDLERGSLFAILRDGYGLRLADSAGSIGAALASPEEARLLGIKRPGALLISEQLTYLDSGQAIEFVRSAYRADRYQMRMHHH
jgi:GntR family transcriptional regulator